VLSERIKPPPTRPPRPVGPGQHVTDCRLPGHGRLPFNGCTFSVRGGNIRLMNTWGAGDGVKKADGRWTVPELVDH